MFEIRPEKPSAPAAPRPGRPPTEARHESTATAPSAASTGRLRWLIIFLLVFGGLGVLIAVQDHGIEQRRENRGPLRPGSQPTTSISPTATPPARVQVRTATELCLDADNGRPSRPNTGGSFVTSTRNGHGQLSIENGTRQDAVVGLTPVGPTRSFEKAVYVRANDKYTVTGIREGLFVIRIMQGRDWSRAHRRFCTDATYSEFVESFAFEEIQRYKSKTVEYTEWSITLQPIIGGTARTRNVDSTAFLLPTQ